MYTVWVLQGGVCVRCWNRRSRLVADEDDADATQRALLWGTKAEPSAELLALQELGTVSTADSRQRANQRFLAVGRKRRREARTREDASGVLGEAEEAAEALREALDEAAAEQAAAEEAEDLEHTLDELCEQVECAIMLHAASDANTNLAEREEVSARIAVERRRGASGFSMWAAGALVLGPLEKRVLLEITSAEERLATLLALLSKSATTGVQQDEP